ncbi:MAG: DUF4135 domain-containing protein, partial [Actinobacteria bacterium]|nr:DUF4135 domain-containing protein [Actinomycetota bacterium]
MTDAVLGRLLEPALDRLAARLGRVGALTAAERDRLHGAAATALYDVVKGLTERVLLVELNAARITGRLTAADPRARWEQWRAEASAPGFWDGLGAHYPTLLPRLHRLIGNRCAAALSLARRFAADRPIGDELVEVELGAGDSHRGGQTVAILTGAGGQRTGYKPRSVAVDRALGRFLARVLDDEPDATRIRVPSAVDRPGYGWVEYIEHRYCANDAELRRFYRNIGHWLAVLRVLGGTDMHAENLIAAGPVPVVVDCETLFTPPPPAPDLGYGAATDRAATLLAGSVLSTGLLPDRGVALGWRGIDQSGVGSLPGQQPAAQLAV